MNQTLILTGAYQLEITMRDVYNLQSISALRIRVWFTRLMSNELHGYFVLAKSYMQFVNVSQWEN